MITLSDVPAPWGRGMDNAFSGVILQPKVVPIYVRTVAPFWMRTSNSGPFRILRRLRRTWCGPPTLPSTASPLPLCHGRILTPMPSSPAQSHPDHTDHWVRVSTTDPFSLRWFPRWSLIRLHGDVHNDVLQFPHRLDIPLEVDLRYCGLYGVPNSGIFVHDGSHCGNREHEKL